jgi:hypothetical protein
MESQNILPKSEDAEEGSPQKPKWKPRGSTEDSEAAQLKFPKRGQYRKKNLAGMRFGRLLVLSESGRTRNAKITWKCLCDCGNETVAIGADMTCGKQVSCGCQRNEASSMNGKKLRIHGLSFTRIASTRKGMIQRCLNPRNKDYRKYGGRGIRVCVAIRNSPATILELLGEKPEGMSVDRKNNDGNYSCGNCSECASNNWSMNIRWATPTQQSRNSRINRMVTINGESRCVADWADISGVTRDVIINRLKAGWSGEKLLSPSRAKHK